MFCEKCGSKNPNDAVFCENCGAPLQNMMEQPVNENVVLNNEMLNSNQSAGIPVINTPVVQKPQRKPVSKLTIAIVAEIVAAICLVCVLYESGRSYFGADQCAKEFFEHLANAEWGDAYEMFNIDESTFINKKAFESAERVKSFENVVNYQVEKSTGTTANQISREINIKYSTKDSGSNSFRIAVNKSKNKKFYLYDEWNINPDAYICESYMIYVPSGATVSFDGVTLDDKYIYDTYSDNTRDVYSIPKFFEGCHDIKVTKDGMEDVTELVYISESFEEYNLEKMKIKDETAETIENLAYENIRKIYTAAVKNESFLSIEDLFTKDETNLEDIKESYEYLCEGLNEDYYNPYRIEFGDITEKVVSDSYNNSYIEVDFGVSYTAYYTYVYWDGDKEDEETSGSKNISMDFVNENGKWVQTNLGCTGIY